MSIGANPDQQEHPKENPGRVDKILVPANGPLLRPIAKSWLEAMARRFDLDITNPRRVRKKSMMPPEQYRELLSKMTQHGYLESDGDFVIPRVVL